MTITQLSVCAVLYVQTCSSLSLVVKLYINTSKRAPLCRKMLFMCPYIVSQPIRKQPVHTCSPGVFLHRSSSPPVLLTATLYVHRIWLGPVQTWGLETGRSKRFESKVPKLGRRRSAWHTCCLWPRTSQCCCPPSLAEADPPAGLYGEPSAWRVPEEGAAARSWAAACSAQGTGHLEGLHGANCLLLCEKIKK